MPYLIKNILFLLCTTTLLLLPIFALLFVFRKKLNKHGINCLVVISFLFVWSFSGGIISWSISKPYAKFILDVQDVKPDSKDARLINIVEETSAKAGLKKIPEIGCYESNELNAFAIGSTKENSLIAVSTGLLEAMDDEELEGVIGHEISHISHGDMVTMTVMNGVANSTIILASRLISSINGNKMFIFSSEGHVVQFFEKTLGILGITGINIYSRGREYNADEGSARLLGKEKIIKALRKLQQNASLDKSSQTNSLSTLKIYGQAEAVGKLFSTHPLLEERIKRLESINMPNVGSKDINTRANYDLSVSTTAKQLAVSKLDESRENAQIKQVAGKKEIPTGTSALNTNNINNTGLQRSAHMAVSALSEGIPMNGMSVGNILGTLLNMIIMTWLGSILGFPIYIILRVSADWGGNSAANLLLSKYYEGKGNKEKSEKELRIAAERGNNEAIYKIGDMELSRGNIEYAFRRFLKIDINADPHFYGLAQRKLGDIYKEGRGKYNKDTKKAFEHYKKAADDGKEPEAMFEIGRMYFDGEGTEMNLKESFKMFRLSADLGNTNAMYRLGLQYIFGQGTEKDDKKGVEYVKKSAKKHNREAQYIFGLMYSECVGVEKNYKKSAKWLNEAVKQGHIDARNTLGILYVEGKVFSLRNLLLDIFGFCKGKGVKYDLNKAVDLFRRSADEDDPYAQSNLGYMYMNGWGVDKDYGKAMDLFKKAEAQGDALAQNNLGYMYMNGWGVDKDYGKALDLFIKAAAQSLAMAQNNLGVMYQNGLGVDKDYDVAIDWFRKAEAKGVALAQYNLALMYGVKQNYKEAEILMNKAADQGFDEAQLTLGRVYYSGYGVSRDYTKALKWLKKAADQGNAEAQYSLGSMYAQGDGVKQDYAEALKWYEKAAD